MLPGVTAVADLADVNLSDTTSYSLMFLRRVVAWYVPKTSWMSLVTKGHSNFKYTACSRNQIEFYLYSD